MNGFNGLLLMDLYHWKKDHNGNIMIIPNVLQMATA